MTKTDAPNPSNDLDEKHDVRDDAEVPPVEELKEDNDPKLWKIHDEHVVPKNNLPLVFFSLLLATFLVCFSLPFISCKVYLIMHTMHHI